MSRCRALRHPTGVSSGQGGAGPLPRARSIALGHEDAVLALVVLAVSIPAAIALPPVWLGDLDLTSRLTLTLAIVAGSGGLALAGSLVVRNRKIGRGAEAVITLPAGPP